MNHRKRIGNPKQFFLWSMLSVLLFTNGLVSAQNVAINSDGSLPDKNAILDIKSASKGLLIPRMSTDARMKIPNTQGLIVYDINTNSFWYNTGRLWQNMQATAMHAVADSAWLLTGNSGTVDGVNFLGTIDNVPFNVRVNNRRSGRIDPTLNNALWGYQSGFNLTTGRDNTAVGSASLLLTTTGFDNTAIGANTLQNNSTGFSNTAVGRFASYYNLTGGGNTAIGTSALHSNERGMDNTAVGGFALLGARGNSNTAVGSNSQVFGGARSQQNTSLGANALAYYDRGDGNTAVGYDALRLTSFDGAYNTAVGHSTYVIPFGPNQQASYSTVIGNSATATGNNSMALGNGASSNAPNKVRIGNAAVTVIEGQVPFTTPSDGRFKFGIQEDVKGIDFIMALRPVTYQFDVRRFDGAANASGVNGDAYDEAANIRRTGFIAQEVEEAAMKSGYNFSGIIKPKSEKEHYSLSYDAFVVPLVKAMQEQQALIEKQKETIEEMKKKNAELESRLIKIEQLLKRMN